MREIKFRAWDEVNKLMRSDVAAIDFEKRKIYFVNEANTLNSDERREFWYEPFKLIEYTGLKDVNGREIYEGDILKLNDRLVTVTWRQSSGTYDCEFIKYTEGHSDLKFQPALPATWCEFEVVGNIYTNNELIK